MKPRFAVVVILTAVVLAAGCRSGRDAAPVIKVNKEFMGLSKDQIFKKGEELFAEKKWEKARSYFSNVYENYPNDPLGRRSLLRIADTFYNQGDAVNLVEAQYKYRDFINRYPGSDFADYAMFQIANVSYKQMEKADRDQTKTKEAVQKFKEMLTAFPQSQYRVEAEKHQQEALDRLARHEHIVARFYMKRGDPNAAIGRLNGIINQYPNYNERDGVFFDLAESLNAVGRKAEARLYYERVVTEFPKSEYAGRAKGRLEDKKA